MTFTVCTGPFIHCPYNRTKLTTAIGSALRNWTLGNFVNGTKNPDGAASLYGANFQAITFAQQNSGYLDASGTPNASLEDALKFSDQRLGSFVDFLRTQGVLDSTLLLVGSKQGQGPVNPKTLQVQDPSVVTDAVGVPVSFFNGEDGGIVSHPSQHSFIHPL